MSYIVNELPKTAKIIDGSDSHWVDIDGSVYAIDGRRGHGNQLIRKVQYTAHGYKYVGIRYINKTKNVSKRVHRLVAQAFIPNPDNLTVIGHKNNIKSDNRVENLYWTTTSENTKKAFNDGLIVNDKGFEDGQSKPVKMFDTKTNKLLGIFGSICEASQETGIDKGIISHQAKYKRPVRKPWYFRYVDDETSINNELVGEFDWNTDKLIKTFINMNDAAKTTGINFNTIQYQCRNGKPKHKFSQTYFQIISNNKCEETIETLVRELSSESESAASSEKEE